MKFRFALLAALITLGVSALAQSSDMYISKFAPATANTGSNLTFTITVGNGGPDDAPRATFTDNLPAGGNFVSLQQTSGAAFTCTTPNVGDPGGTVTCTITTMTAGTSATFDIVVSVPTASAGTTLINNATTSSDNPDDNPENNTSITGTSIPGGDVADVAVTKSGPSASPANSDVTYTITVTNFGPNDAQTVSLTDTLPDSSPGGNPMTFVSFTQNSGPAFNCGAPSTSVTCTIATLPLNSTATFTYVGHIPTGTTTGKTYTNVANITSANDPSPENDSASTSLTVSSADVGVTKTAPATAVAGGPTFNYVITLTNSGPDAATNASFNDALPAGINFVSLVQNSGPSANCTTPAANTNGTVGCSIGIFSNGNSAQFTITVQAAATLANGTVVSNTATARTDSADTNPNNDTSSASTTINAQADVAINKTAPASVTAGTNLTYTITVNNNGPSNAASVAWTDALPAGTTFVSLNQTSGPAFNCSGTTTISCSVATLANGASATFSLVVAVSPGATGVLSNTATVTSPTPDTNNGNNSSTAPTTVNVSSDVSITKNGAPASIAAGNNITWTIVVSNTGPSTATTVTMTDVLPANTAFVSLGQSGAAFNCTTPAAGAAGTVTCTAATLATGASTTFTLVASTAVTTPPGTISNTATVSSASADPNNGNNSATSSTTVGQVDLSLTKTVPAGPFSAGGTVTFTLTATNNSAFDASNVVVTDNLPSPMTMTGSTPPGACTGTTTVTCTAATLPANASTTFTITATVPLAGNYTNSATITSANGESNPANNTGSAGFAVLAAAAIPTLSPAVLMLLAAVLGFAALTMLKR